jgi:hypothetical protein
MENDLINIIETTLANIIRIQTFKNSPGKFEGQSLAANWFYDLGLKYGNWVMNVKAGEKILFSLSENDNFVFVDESESGFVSVVFFETEAEADEYEFAQTIVEFDEMEDEDEETEE